MSGDQSSGFARISGHRIYYETYGFGDRGTIIIVPGGPGLSHDYLHSLADLAPLGYRVVFYDPLGCGRSERPGKAASYSFRNSVSETGDVPQALRISGPVHLVGHSYGGLIAVEAAVLARRRVASLVLFSPSVRLPEVSSIWGDLTGLPPAARRFMTRRNVRFEDMWAGGSRTGYRRFQKGYAIFTRLRVLRMNVAPYEVVHSMQGGNWDAARAILRSESDYYGALSPEDAARRYEKLDVPSLLTVGRYDQIAASGVRALQRRIPHSRMVMFQRSSHLANWEERERFIETLDRFFRRES